MQQWRKLGRVFCVAGTAPWMKSHASVPTVLVRDNLARVYFGTRDAKQQASISYFEVDLRSPLKVLRVAETPVLTGGALGTFDDSGVLPSWVVEREGQVFLYYIGWNLGVTVPFRNFTGLAISRDGGETFIRHSLAPVADRDAHDPYFFTNPCLLKDGDHWKIWYLSAVRWEAQKNSAPKHFYHIKCDRSVDGIKWQRNPSVAIDFKYPGEFAISRPCVLRENNKYLMWYSYRSGPRGQTYRIGYAESGDGHAWTRLDDKVGLDVSPEGWDSNAISYAHVIAYQDKKIMFYNGNNFGETGIGLAVLE